MPQGHISFTIIRSVGKPSPTNADCYTTIACCDTIIFDPDTEYFEWYPQGLINKYEASNDKLGRYVLANTLTR